MKSIIVDMRMLYIRFSFDLVCWSVLTAWLVSAGHFTWAAGVGSFGIIYLFKAAKKMRAIYLNNIYIRSLLDNISKEIQKMFRDNPMTNDRQLAIGDPVKQQVAENVYRYGVIDSFCEDREIVMLQLPNGIGAAYVSELTFTGDKQCEDNI